MLRRLCSAGAFALLSTAASVASAREAVWVPKAQGNRIGAEIDWLPTANFDILDFGVVGQIEIARRVYLDFDVPWAMVVDHDIGNDRVTFGNPTVGVHYAATVNEHFSLFVGGTFTLSTSLSSGDATVRIFATNPRALFDAHRFQYDAVFLRPRGGLEIRIVPILYYRVDFTPVILIDVGDRRQDHEMLIDIGNEFEARGSSGVGGGLRLQAVVMFNEAYSDDRSQTAIEPYFVYEPTRGFYARIGSLVALDEPLGSEFDNIDATLRVSLGIKR